MLLALNLVLFFLFLVAIVPVEDRILFERKQVLAKEILLTASSEINSAAIIGDGYARRFTVSERLRDNTNFSLNIDPYIQRLTIYWGESEGSYGINILTSNVSGEFSHGPHLIRNVAGTVVIEAA